MIANPYNELNTSLVNIASALTDKTDAEIERTVRTEGTNGVIRLISENIKPFVTREEVQEMFDAAVNKIIKELKGAD